MFVDLPPQMPIQEVRLVCSTEAAARYNLPADLVFAVALTEGGKPDSKVQNTNGTFDLGLMQFNTSYLKTLEKFGISSSDVQGKTCYPFHLAAWRISLHLKENTGDDYFTKASYYHSRTSYYNSIYKEKLISNAMRYDGLRAISLYKDLVKQQKKNTKKKVLATITNIHSLRGQKVTYGIIN